MEDDSPRSLRLNEVIARRQRMLREPHIAPLTDFVDRLRQKYKDWEFPDFDPLDSGIEADTLLLFEKPGRKTSAKGGGSGFISRNNNDATAEATFNFLNEAGLSRKRTVIWNTIPGWNGTRKITPDELRAGINDLSELISLLPKLRTVILVGKKAQKAGPLIKRNNSALQLIESAHSSPIVRATSPDVWQSIPRIWARASISKKIL